MFDHPNKNSKKQGIQEEDDYDDYDYFEKFNKKIEK